MVKRIFFALLICPAGCQASRSTEQKLVGSWDFNRSIDSVDTITYEADHTFFVSVRFQDDRWTDCWGSWRLEGSEIVRDVTYMKIPPGDDKTTKDLIASYARKPRHVRETIVELTPNSFKVKALVESKEELVDHVRTTRPPKPTVEFHYFE
jgi:hypothetical protein